jgi:hypothetical protein
VVLSEAGEAEDEELEEEEEEGEGDEIMAPGGQGL